VEPWQVWATLAILTAIYAKARVLIHDATRAYYADIEEEYNHYVAASIIDAIFIIFLFILLIKVI